MKIAEMATEKKIEGITGEAICEGIKAHGHKDVLCVEGKKSAVTYLKNHLKNGKNVLKRSIKLRLLQES